MFITRGIPGHSFDLSQLLCLNAAQMLRSITVLFSTNIPIGDTSVRRNL